MSNINSSVTVYLCTWRWIHVRHKIEYWVMTANLQIRQQLLDNIEWCFIGVEQRENAGICDISHLPHLKSSLSQRVSVASKFLKRQGQLYGNALAISRDDSSDRNDKSSEIDCSSNLATETTGNWFKDPCDRGDRSYPTLVTLLVATSAFMEEMQRYECLYNEYKFCKDYKNRRTRENA